MVISLAAVLLPSLLTLPYPSVQYISAEISQGTDQANWAGISFLNPILSPSFFRGHSLSYQLISRENNTVLPFTDIIDTHHLTIRSVWTLSLLPPFFEVLVYRAEVEIPVVDTIDPFLTNRMVVNRVKYMHSAEGERFNEG